MDRLGSLGPILHQTRFVRTTHMTAVWQNDHCSYALPLLSPLFVLLYSEFLEPNRATIMNRVSRREDVPSPSRTSSEDRKNELRRVRARQQEEAAQQSLAAEARKKEKDAKDRERRNTCAKQTTAVDGNKLGGGGGPANSTNETTRFNALQPWSSTSRGYRCA